MKNLIVLNLTEYGKGRIWLRMLFEVISKLGRRIRVTKSYWEIVVTKKHPSVAGMIEEVMLALKDPDEVRRSRFNGSIYLYYKRLDDMLICVVTKHLDEEGFLVTTYLTNKIKRGETVWKKT